MAVKSYFDGSGDPGNRSERYLTLGSYSGSANAWQHIAPIWSKVLDKHDAAYLHMFEAASLKGEFRISNGWNRDRVTRLLLDLADVVNCWHERTLLPVVVSVEMNSYAATALTMQHNSQVLRAAAVCSVQCCQRILGSLNQNPADSNSTIEIYRDDRDPYLGELVNDWRSIRIRREQQILNKIDKIEAVDMKETPGIQMADMIAWTAHRCLTYPEDQRAQMLWLALRVVENKILGGSNPA